MIVGPTYLHWKIPILVWFPRTNHLIWCDYTGFYGFSGNYLRWSYSSRSVNHVKLNCSVIVKIIELKEVFLQNLTRKRGR